MERSFSFYRPGYSFVNSFFPRYKQGDTVYVMVNGRKMRGKIVGAYLDRDMNFDAWQVNVPSLRRYSRKRDPKCPW
jgi:hypothetical protein